MKTQQNALTRIRYGIVYVMSLFHLVHRKIVGVMTDEFIQCKCSFGPLNSTDIQCWQDACWHKICKQCRSEAVPVSTGVFQA